MRIVHGQAAPLPPQVHVERERVIERTSELKFRHVLVASVIAALFGSASTVLLLVMMARMIGK